MVRKLKNLIVSTLAVTTIATSVIVATQEVEAKESTIKVEVNGEYITFDEPPVLENGSVFVPMRAIFESLGYEVSWNTEFEAVESAIEKENYLITMALYKGNQMNLTYKEYKTDYKKFDGGRSTDRQPIDCSTDFTNITTFNPSYKNVNGRILVPVRAISEGTGADVKWDGATQTVIIDSSNPVIKNVATGESYDVNNAKQRVENYFGSSNGQNNSDSKENTTNNNNGIVSTKFSRGEATLEEHQAEVLRLINIERENAGIPPLEADPLLMEIAQLKAEEMEEFNYFGHESPNYGSPSQFARNYGYNYNVAENIGKGGYVPSASVAMFMTSNKGHKEIILDPNYKYLGVGRVGDIYNSIDVQMFR